jgi:biofilm PGA synthesis protein PgaD
MNDIVIDRPELQTPAMRALFHALTLVMWSFYLYLMLPLGTLLAWWIGFSAVYEEMVVRSGWESLLQLVGVYSVILLLIALSQVGWAMVNWLRFRGKRDRRRLQERKVDMDVSHMFLADHAEHAAWQEAKRLVVHHHPVEHRITAVQIG